MTQRKKRTTKQERELARRFRDGNSVSRLAIDLWIPHEGMGLMSLEAEIQSILRKFIVVPEEKKK